MIKVQIGSDERVDDAITQDWINQQLRRRHDAGEPVCVRVSIHTSSLNIGLATMGCAGGGGGRPPYPQERPVIDLWRKRGLSEADFQGGNLVAFLKQVRQMI
jgi:hypothetical protein